MSDAVQPQEAEEAVDPLALFSELVRLNVQGLALLGHIQREVKFCGHTFVLRTLRPAEKAAVALAVKPYQGTIAEPEVWANAQVALSLVSVDGSEDFCPPIGPNLEEFAKTRLAYITNAVDGWYAPTLAYLYDQILELEQESLDAVRELQNLSSRNPVPSSPSPDSSTVQGTSDAPIALVTPP